MQHKSKILQKLQRLFFEVLLQAVRFMHTSSNHACGGNLLIWCQPKNHKLRWINSSSLTKMDAKNERKRKQQQQQRNQLVSEWIRSNLWANFWESNSKSFRVYTVRSCEGDRLLERRQQIVTRTPLKFNHPIFTSIINTNDHQSLPVWWVLGLYTYKLTSQFQWHWQEIYDDQLRWIWVSGILRSIALPAWKLHNSSA